MLPENRPGQPLLAQQRRGSAFLFNDEGEQDVVCVWLTFAGVRGPALSEGDGAGDGGGHLGEQGDYLATPQAAWI